MSIQTSITTPSSTRLRLRALTPRICKLGDRPVFELLCELNALSSAALPRIEAYAALSLHSDLLDAFGGRDLSPTIRCVK